MCSENHGMAEVGRDLWRCSGPTPEQAGPRTARLLRATFSQHLSISKDGDSTTSLGSLCQCLITLTVNHFFLMFRWIFLYFNLCHYLFITSLGTTGKSLFTAFVHTVKAVHVFLGWVSAMSSYLYH